MSFKPFTLAACELGKADYLNLLVLMVLYDDRFAFCTIDMWVKFYHQPKTDGYIVHILPRELFRVYTNKQVCVYRLSVWCSNDAQAISDSL